MKNFLKILAVFLVLATVVTAFAFPTSAKFDETVNGYDSYGYYAYFDFEKYGNAANHADYMENANSTNADGKLCDPFGQVNTVTRIDGGSGTVIEDADGNHYYSYVTAGNTKESNMGVFKLSLDTPGDLIIGKAVEISFRFRVHSGLTADANSGITDSDLMPLVHLRRGDDGTIAYLYSDAAGNLYGEGKIDDLIYTNTSPDKFLNIQLKWYDFSNTVSLYVNGSAIYEAMPITQKNLRSFTTSSFDDDFIVTEINQNTTVERSFEICRANTSTQGKKWAYDIDDIKVARIESAQGGAYYYSNEFDVASNGLSEKSTASSVHVYGGKNSSAFVGGHGTEKATDGSTVGYLTASKNYFGIYDTYQLLSADSFVTEFRIKGKATQTSGLKQLVQFITDGNNNDFTNYISLLYVDKNQQLYLDKQETTLVNGFTLSESEWLDVTIVAVKNETNAGKFGKLTGKTISSSNMTYTFSYFFNGEYVGSTTAKDFVEWRKTTGNSKYRTASGDEYTSTKYTVDGTNVTALDVSDTSVYEVVDSTTTENHVIYKSVIDGVTQYYDVETVDGVQTTYTVMTITDETNLDSIRFAGSSFELKYDYLKIYEGTCPEWFYESLYSEKGGDIWNVNFAHIGRVDEDNKKAITASKGPDVSGTVYNAGFATKNQTVNGANVVFTDDAQFDFYLPVPRDSEAFVGEYSYEVEIKNITDAKLSTSGNDWKIGLFNQRFENASGTNKPTSSLMTVGSGTVAGDMTLYGIGGIALYNADGSVATLDSKNGNRLRADLYINTEAGEYGVSYYLDSEILYLADGTPAFRVENSTVNLRMSEFYGKVQNFRVRLIHVSGTFAADIPYAKVKINEQPSYETVDTIFADNSVNLMTFDLPKLSALGGNGTVYDLVKLEKGDGESELSLLFANSSTGELIVGTDGKYYALCNKEGSTYKLSDDEVVTFALVYDDIKGDVRYYVNNEPAYISVEDVLSTTIDLAVVNVKLPSAHGNIICKLFGGVSSEEALKLSDYNFKTNQINDNDTAEIIGFQENTLTNGIRIVAGVDALYYHYTGFEIQIYENGELKKSENKYNSQVFSSIIANNEDITSDEYSYFSTVNVVGLPEDIPENSYILVRSYTLMAGVKHYDEQVKICVTNDGYFFAAEEEKDDTEYYKRKQIVLLMGQSNMSGRGLLPYVEPISDSRITVLYDDLGWVPMEEPLHRDAANPGISLAGSFAKAFVETFDCDLGLVPLAVGGTSLKDWTAGSSDALYEKTVKMAKEAMKSGEICAILWHQGEADRAHSSYAKKFKNIMDSLIDELGLDADKIAIITGELQQFGTGAIDVVNNALHSTELTDYYKRYAVASAEGLTNVELKDSHFDAPSQRVFGYRYFECFYEEVRGRECPYEYSQNPLDYRIEPPVVESNKDSYYISDIDFNGYTEGSVIEGLYYSGNGGSISEGVDKYMVFNRTFENNPYMTVTSVTTVGKDIVVEMDFRLSGTFNSATSSGALIKLTPKSGSDFSNSIVLVRLNGEGYILLDNVDKEKVGEPIAADEWTKVRVVCHMDSNTKDVYVYGTGYEAKREGAVLHTTYDTSTFPVEKITIGQIGSILNGTLHVDNIKVYERPLTLEEMSDNVKLLGRAYELDTGIALDHSASGFAFNFNGRGNIVLDVTSTFGTDTAELAKLSVTIDGKTTKNIIVPEGTSEILIAKGLEEDEHTVEIVKESDVLTTVTVNKVAFTGSLLDKPADKNLYIEFIGDSITAGYGLSAEEEGSHHDATLSYAYRTAQMLGADYAIFARSGMGIAYAEGNVNLFENRYPYLSYIRNTSDLYAPERTPDLVVINLAQNDNSQWNSNGDNKQGDKYNNDTFDAKFGGMIDTVTELYGKDIPILFVYGCMQSSSYEPLATIRSQYLIESVYTKEAGYNITYTTLTTNRGGYKNHPTADGALVQANELANYIFDNYSDINSKVLETLQNYIPSSWNSDIARIPEEPNGFMFAIQTDTHFSVESGASAGNSIKALSNVVPISFYANLGDYIKGYYAYESGKIENTPENTLYSIKELTNRYLNFTDTPVLATFGNHDTNQLWCKYYGEANQQLTQTDHYNYVTSRLKAHNGDAMVTDGESNYYYMDFVKDNIRVVMLNTTDGSYESEFDSVSTISDKQLAWFKDVALDTEMNVLVMTHIPLCEDFPESSGDRPYNGDKVMAAVEEFIADGGSFIAYMYGHTHKQLQKTDEYGRLHISFANGGTKAEIVIIDTVNKQISTVALGDKEDRTFNY